FGALSNILKDAMYSSIRFVLSQTQAHKGHQTQQNAQSSLSSNRITAGQLLQQNGNDQSLLNVEPTCYDSASYILNNLCPTVLGNIRGSSMYFRKCGRHLKSMVTNLGPPFAFLTFS